MDAAQARQAILEGTAPPGLVVEGLLALDGTAVSRLPEGLDARDGLSVQRCPHLTALPLGLKARFLSAQDTPLEALPAGLVLESLALRGAPLAALPAGLEVTQSLSLQSLPNLTALDAVVASGAVEVEDCPALAEVGPVSCQTLRLTALPALVKVGAVRAQLAWLSQADLLATLGPVTAQALVLHELPSLTALPRALAVETLRLDNCGLLEVHAEVQARTLTVEACPRLAWLRGPLARGFVHVEDCLVLCALPEGLATGALEVLRCPALTALPQGLVVEGDVDVSGCSVAALPADARVQGQVTGLAAPAPDAFVLGLEAAGRLPLLERGVALKKAAARLARQRRAPAAQRAALDEALARLDVELSRQAARVKPQGPRAREAWVEVLAFRGQEAALARLGTPAAFEALCQRAAALRQAKAGEEPQVEVYGLVTGLARTPARRRRALLAVGKALESGNGLVLFAAALAAARLGAGAVARVLRRRVKAASSSTYEVQQALGMCALALAAAGDTRALPLLRRAEASVSARSAAGAQLRYAAAMLDEDIGWALQTLAQNDVGLAYAAALLSDMRAREALQALAVSAQRVVRPETKRAVREALRRLKSSRAVPKPQDWLVWELGQRHVGELALLRVDAARFSQGGLPVEVEPVKGAAGG